MQGGFVALPPTVALTYNKLKPPANRTWLFHYRDKIYVRHGDGTWGAAPLDQQIMDELRGRKFA